MAAPQFFVSSPQAAVGHHTSQTVRSPFGTHSHHHKTVTDLDGSAQVHRFDSRFHNNAGAQVVRVARPRLVNTGPFAVQALPHQTPIVVGGSAGSTPVITAARGSATNIFQTPDGRIFAYSNGANQIVPGQIFQTPDGRIFTTAVINQNTHNNQQPIQQQQQPTVAAEPQSEVIEVRTPKEINQNINNNNQALLDALVATEAIESESEVIEAVRDTSDYDEDLFDYESEEDVFDSVFDEEEPEMEEQSTEVPALATEEEEVVEEVEQVSAPINQQDVIVTQTGQGLPHFVAVPQQTFVARAPLTPATSRFVPTRFGNVNAFGHTGVQHIFRNNFAHNNVFHAGHAAAPALAPTVFRAAPATTVFRAAPSPIAAPVAVPALAQGVSSGYFSFPGAGLAFQF